MDCLLMTLNMVFKLSTTQNGVNMLFRQHSLIFTIAMWTSACVAPSHNTAFKDTCSVERDSASSIETIEDEDDSGGQFTEPNDSGDITEPQATVYCEGNDPALANCDPDVNFDPWIAGTGEVHYWIRDKKTEVFPFTTEDHPDVWFGYLQMTSPEVAREPTEDLFHVWFSETPNGPLYGGADCEWYFTRAERDVFWTFKSGEELEGICHLGAVSQTLYVNFETRCHPDYYEGPCDDDNKQKSDRVYQFDVARRYRLY